MSTQPMADSLREILSDISSGEKLVLHFGPSRFSGILGHVQACGILEDLAVDFDAIYGSQFGVIPAVMRAFEIPHREVLHFAFHGLDRYNIFDFRVRDFLRTTLRLNPLNLNGVCYGEGLTGIYSALLAGARRETSDRLHLFAENFHLNKLRIFSIRGITEAMTAMKAATAITAIYPPVQVENELYVDSGLFGGLPLRKIYNHQCGLARKKKLKMTVVAFQEAFSSRLPDQNIADRLVYSFNEKIRYHSTLIEIAEIRRLPVRLVLISFQGGEARKKSLLNMSRNDKWHYIQEVEKDIRLQMDYYVKNLRGNQRKCALYPVAR